MLKITQQEPVQHLSTICSSSGMVKAHIRTSFVIVMPRLPMILRDSSGEVGMASGGEIVLPIDNGGSTSPSFSHFTVPLNDRRRSSTCCGSEAIAEPPSYDRGPDISRPKHELNKQ